MQTPAAFSPVGTFTSLLRLYKRECKRCDAVMEVLNNQRSMAFEDARSYQLRGFHKRPLFRERNERNAMFCEDEWEYKYDLGMTFDLENPLPVLVVGSNVIFEYAVITMDIIDGLKRTVLYPEYPLEALQALAAPVAPVQARVRPPSTPIQSVLAPRVLFTDNCECILPPGKLQRMGDAAIVPMTVEEINNLSIERRLALHQAMVDRENRELRDDEDPLTYYDDGYISDGLATGEEPHHSESESLPSEEEEDDV